MGLLLWGMASEPALARPAAVATDIRVNADRDMMRMVLETDRLIRAEIFALADPYRLVIDLPELGWRLPSKPLPSAQGVFEKVRFGLFKPGVSRVVIELNQPVEVLDAFTLSGRSGNDTGGGRLVIDVRRTTPDRFAGLMSLPKRSVDTARRQQPTPATPKPSLALRQLPEQLPAQAAPLPGRGTQTAALAPRHPLPPKRPGRGSPRYLPMIVIDPGHGGVDPGAIGITGLYEKHVALAIGKELRRQLKRTGRYRVAMTRDRDVFIRLRDRVAFARDRKADLFISIHADSIHKRGLRGISVYTLSEKASDKEAAALAEKENKADLIAGIDLSDEAPEVTDILIDLAQRETMNSSARFATKVLEGLAPNVRLLSRAHRFAGFAVLKAPDVPSVLLETGFLSNPQDEKLLRDRAYWGRMSTGIVTGIDQYFQGTEQATRP